MRILLATIGSAGDVHPFVAISLSLKQRGHEVLILTNPYFKERIVGAGIGFWPLGDADNYLRLIKDSQLIAGARSPGFVIDNLITPAFAPTIDAIRDIRAAFKPDVIAHHHICFGAAAACELRKIPSVQCVLAPLFWFSRCERIVLPSLPIPNAPAPIDWVLRSFARFMGRRTFDPAINRLRREVGLPAQRDLISFAARGGDGVLPSERLASPSEGTPSLALWSPLLRGPLADDPCTGRICGFAVWDRPPRTSEELDLERDTVAWMSPNADGNPGASRAHPGRPSSARANADAPIVVTLGSSVSHHGEDVYKLAAETCATIGARALLLTGGSADSSPWPDHVRAVPYAPYSSVMPRARVIVHHAGIGTLAAAMRAGRPQIIIPFANDEFDNAARAERLGIAIVIKRRKLSKRSLAEALKRATVDQSMIRRTAEIGEGMRDEDGAAIAATEIARAI